MRKIFLFFIFPVALLKSQTTAQDWIKTDCQGNIHHLFNELDNGKVVILDFVHLGCGTCIIGTTYLDQIYQDYAVSNPGRVQLYCMSYDNVATCQELDAWGTTYGFAEPKFPNCEGDVNYYGGMGMPTVVILGGSAHSVFYNNKGFGPADDAPARTAVNNALAAPVSVDAEIHSGLQVNLFSAPKEGEYILSLDQIKPGNLKIGIFDVAGREKEIVFEDFYFGSSGQFPVSGSGLSEGLYFVVVSTAETRVCKRLLIAR